MDDRWARRSSGSHLPGSYAMKMALYTFNHTLRDSSGNGKAIVTAPLDISVAALPQVTFGAWVKAVSVSNPEYGIISNDDGNFDRSLDIDNRDAATGANWSAFVGNNVVGKVPAAKGRWVFLAVSFDQSSSPGRYALYVNDGSRTTVLRGADAFDGNSVTSRVTIGRNPSYDQPFDGEVANAFFYRGILTGAQIKKIIAKGPSAIPGYRKLR
ncbi:MAG: LamG-like jellyroll fold domain-containing protein [Bacillati bacterium]